MTAFRKASHILILTIACCIFSSFTFSQDTCANPPVLVKAKAGWLKIERLATLSEPWGMAWLPNGSLLVTEKPGRLRIYSNGQLSEPVSGLPAIEYHKQGGLLDVEVDPQFSENKYIYIYYSERANPQSANHPTRDPGDPRLGDNQDYSDAVLKGGAVARGKLEGTELKDVQMIWRQVPKTNGRGHFGGRIIFATDGTLFITSGDRQRFDPAQNLNSNLGKVVRINRDGSIPRDNPYASNKNARGDVWSTGHRNPLGAVIHPGTNRLWIHEMGPRHGDELIIPEKGKNYGWPVVSNGDNYNFEPIPDHPTKPQYTPPLFYWHPAISPSGMAFYTDTLFKDWNGTLLIGSFNLEGLIVLTFEGNKIKSEERIGLRRRVRDLIQASDGTVWLITDYKEGELIKLSSAKF